MKTNKEVIDIVQSEHDQVEKLIEDIGIKIEELQHQKERLQQLIIGFNWYVKMLKSKGNDPEQVLLDFLVEDETEESQ
tara:strand:+ start:4470 stop:4703 length:234 start_codon:yes stop_codon:yes gene_type:complete